MEEKTLIEAARLGSREAFETIVKRYEKKVFHLAFSFVRDRASADDLAQEVFVKAYFALPKFHFKSEFGTWLYRIAANHIKDHLRKVSRRKEVSIEEFEDVAFVSDDQVKERERIQAEDQRKKIVFRVLATLPQKYRMILTLRDIRGFSYEEITRILKISPGTVDSRLHRARKLLRNKMTPYLGAEGGAYEV
ncbi:MAG: sigma-70 family RNA polymerase sigma factor [Candidatus Aminicenantales bacterium]|jgi:RNA polymerase sigma-70 factor, ECF subfamily